MEHPPEDLEDSVAHIVFGWDRPTDERSCAAFVRRFASAALLEALVPRLTDDELAGLVDQLSGLLRAHLTEGEYHRLFLSRRPRGPAPGG